MRLYKMLLVAFPKQLRAPRKKALPGLDGSDIGKAVLVHGQDFSPKMIKGLGMEGG